MRRFWRRFKGKLMAIVAAVLAVIVVMLSLVLLFSGAFSGKEAGPVVNIANLQQQVLSIGELATIEYNYTDVIDSSTSLTIKDWPVPGTKKSVVAVLDGTMKIGFDVSKILIDSSESAKNVTITIPKAVVLDHYTHDETLRVLDEKSGLFNPVTIEDYIMDVASKKKEMEAKALKDGLFARAEEEARAMIAQFVGAIVPEDYVIDVTVADAAA